MCVWCVCVSSSPVALCLLLVSFVRSFFFLSVSFRCLLRFYFVPVSYLMCIQAYLHSTVVVFTRSSLLLLSTGQRYGVVLCGVDGLSLANLPCVCYLCLLLHHLVLSYNVCSSQFALYLSNETTFFCSLFDLITHITKLTCFHMMIFKFYLLFKFDFTSIF